jgi:hypothetical protein
MVSPGVMRSDEQAVDEPSTRPPQQSFSRKNPRAVPILKIETHSNLGPILFPRSGAADVSRPPEGRIQFFPRLFRVRNISLQIPREERDGIRSELARGLR